MNTKHMTLLRPLPGGRSYGKPLSFAHQILRLALELRYREYGAKSLALLLALMLTVATANAQLGSQKSASPTADVVPGVSGVLGFAITDTKSQGLVISVPFGKLLAPRVKVLIPASAGMYPEELVTHDMGCTFGNEVGGTAVTCPLVIKVSPNAIYFSKTKFNSYLDHLLVPADYSNWYMGGQPMTVGIPMQALVICDQYHCPGPEVLKTPVTVTVTDANNISTVSLTTTLGKVAVVLNPEVWSVGISSGHQSCDEGSSSGLPNFGILLGNPNCGPKVVRMMEQISVAAAVFVVLALAPGADAADILSWAPFGSESNNDFIYPAFID